MEVIFNKKQIKDFFDKIAKNFNVSKDVNIGDYVKFKVNKSEQ